MGVWKIHGLKKDLWREKELAIERFRPNIVVGADGVRSKARTLVLASLLTVPLNPTSLTLTWISRRVGI